MDFDNVFLTRSCFWEETMVGGLSKKKEDKFNPRMTS